MLVNVCLLQQVHTVGAAAAVPSPKAIASPSKEAPSSVLRGSGRLAALSVAMALVSLLLSMACFGMMAFMAFLLLDEGLL